LKEDLVFINYLLTKKRIKILLCNMIDPYATIKNLSESIRTQKVSPVMVVIFFESLADRHEMFCRLLPYQIESHKVGHNKSKRGVIERKVKSNVKAGGWLMSPAGN
jgi:hypothetical protein